MKVLVSKTRYIFTVLSEQDIRVKHGMVQSKDGKFLRVERIRDNMLTFIESTSLYWLTNILIVILSSPDNLMELVGLIVGFIAIFLSFEKIPFMITIVGLILATLVFMAIFVPPMRFFTLIGNGVIVGAGIGYFSYLIFIAWKRGFITEEKDLFILEGGLWKNQ